LVEKLYDVITENLENLIEKPPKLKLPVEKFSHNLDLNKNNRDSSNQKIEGSGRGRGRICKKV
jgi:hypothetical protein